MWRFVMACIVCISSADAANYTHYFRTLEDSHLAVIKGSCGEELRFSMIYGHGFGEGGTGWTVTVSCIVEEATSCPVDVYLQASETPLVTKFFTAIQGEAVLLPELYADFVWRGVLSRHLYTVKFQWPSSRRRRFLTH